MVSARKSIPSVVPLQAVVQSHAESNRALAEAFERYLISRGFSPPTLRAYMDSVNRYVAHRTIGQSRRRLATCRTWREKAFDRNVQNRDSE